MDTASLQRFKEVLGQNDRVAVVVGKNPNIDEMAAALALYLSLKASHKTTSVVSVSQPIVELSSLVGIDEVRGSFGSAGGDLVVSFPYQEGEIEKVSYTIENGLLNIVVKAGEHGLNFQEQDVRFSRGGGLPSLLIIVGTPSLTAVSELLNQDGLKDATIVNIDNKAENEGFGDIVLVNTQFSSVSEQMANLMLANGLPMDVDAAQNLMLGISYATNNFQNPQTSYFAFEIMAELMRRGAVRVPPVTQPVQTPSYMQQPQVQQATQPRAQGMPRPQQMPQRPNYGQQQRGGQQQNQQRMQPRMNQQNQQQRGNQQQNQASRQDEIRRALAEQARAMQAQAMPQPTQNPTVPPMAQPQQVTQPVNHPAPADREQPTEAPSDWLTPKVYKGSSNPS